MGIPKLESCPKCKGHLILEKDNYGSYQQCLQCGYLHDLQTFPSIAIEQTEDDQESKIPQHVSANGSCAIFRDTTRLIEDSHKTALADPLDFRLVLDAPHKRHQENR